MSAPTTHTEKKITDAFSDAKQVLEAQGLGISVGYYDELRALNGEGWPTSRTIIRAYRTWSNAVAAFGGRDENLVAENTRRGVEVSHTEDEIIAALQRAYKILDKKNIVLGLETYRTLISQNEGGWPSVRQIYNHFESWSAALNAANIKPREEKLLRILKKARSVLAARGEPITWNGYKDLRKERVGKNWPVPETFAENFGTWSNAIVRIGGQLDGFEVRNAGRKKVGVSSTEAGATTPAPRHPAQELRVA